MRAHSSLAERSFLFSIFHPAGFFRKLTGALLTWVMVMSSLPVYATQHSVSNWIEGFTPAAFATPKATRQPSASVMPVPAKAVVHHLMSASPLLGAVQPPPLLSLNQPLSLDLLRRPFPDAPTIVFSPMQSSSSQLQVSGGFADSSSASASFPEPWNETNPAISFNGGGKIYSTGAQIPVQIASLGKTPFSSILTSPMLQTGPPAGTSSIASNFNGTAISGGNALWFSSVVKVSGIGTSPVRVFLRASSVQFSAGGKSYQLPVPDATITFSPSATSAITAYDPNRVEWITTLPSTGLAGNDFLSGLTLIAPAAGLPGGTNPVTWSGTFYSDTPGVSINWQWAAAVYTSFGTDYRTLAVKPVDDNSASQYKNSDHAGTPEAYKTFVTGGARGGGGSNYTGSYSGTASVIPINQVPNYPPVANAGPNQTAHVTDTVQLDGTGSTDRDGDPLTYRWSFVSVPAGSIAILNNPTTAKPTFTVDRPGTYTLQLIVNDGKVDSSPSQMSVTTLNSPPVANAGPDQTVFQTTTVHLDGSKSSDVDGDSLTYKWSLISVPPGSAAQLSTTTAVNPTFNADVKGTYIAQLIVNDGHVDGAPSTVTISSVNSPPVANAGADQRIQAGQTVALDGSKSSDVDGDPLTFRWSILSAPAGSSAALSDPTAVRPSFFADRVGAYIFQLIVNDGFVDSAPVTVSVTTENVAPVADAGANQSVFVNTTVVLDGSRSRDVDGDSITYRWSLLSVPANSSARLSDPTVVNPSFRVDLKGTYVAQLIVNDGFVDSAPATVIISTLNSPPVANAGAAPSVLAGTTVSLNGSGSTDVDGDSLTFRWSITSKPSNSNAVLTGATSVTPTFFADQLGTYVVQLIVNDGTVDSSPSTVTITTQDSPPVANAGPAQTVPLGALVTLDGTGSSDPDGQVITYQWSLLSTPPGSRAALANPAAVHPTFTADLAGNYVAQLIVNDGFLSSTPSTVTVSTINSIPVANAGPNQMVKTRSTVQLDGSGSSDADHDPLTYRWAITVRPSGSAALLSSTTVVNPTFVADADGTYVAQLIVNDGKVDSAPSTVMIVAQNPNQPPVVSAGPDQTITLPTNTVTLNGTATDDGLPAGILNITWSEVSGPAAVTFSSPNTAVTQATFTFVGTYVLQLTASDTQLTSSSDVTITVKSNGVNQAPVVNAGPGGEVSLPNAFQLNGSASDDGLPVGKLIVSWSAVSGPSTPVFANPNQAVTSVLFDSPGTYVLRLTASDTALSSSEDVQVVVLRSNGGKNQPPFVDAGPDQIVTLPNPVTLNGTALDDGLPKGVLLTTWSQVSGPATVVFADPTNPKTTATLPKPGDYVLRLSASDTALVSTSDMHVTVGMLTGTRNSKGTEFWLMFDETDNESLATASLFITSETGASGTVSVPGLNFTQNFSVGATQITNVVLPNQVFHLGSDRIQNLGIHVVADHEVTVYGLNFEQFAADAYLGLPVSALGTEYINASYSNVAADGIHAILPATGTQFGLVAAYDNTTVTVTPTITTGGRKQGVPYSFVLHRGRTYQLQDKVIPNDLTGTIISADKPIAVFGSHKCSYVLSSACNHLVEQLPSTDTWGSRFVTVPLKTRKNGDTFRFISATDGTAVTINGQVAATINRGEFYETLLTQPSYIVSSNPILTVQYSNGTSFDGVTGDPYMIVVPPVEQFRAAYTVTTVQPGYFLENFLNIVIPTSAKRQLQLDGVTVDLSSFTDVAGSGFSTAQLTVSQGAHRVVSTTPFGVFSYGFAPFDGYGYTGGIALPGVPGGSISLFPSTATQATNTQACFVASVADAAQNTLSAINVTFSVAGANPQTGSVDTDNNGQAQFCYTGANAGSDTVTGSIVTTTATASINWQANAANQAPQVSLPAALSVSLPSTARLIGIVTDDGLPPGGGLTFTWSQVSGPGATTFSNAAAVITTGSFSAPGDYVLQLTASDSLLAGSATTTVHVSDNRPNKAPVITPLPAQTLDFSPDPQGTLTLAPTVNDDGLPVGSKLSYNWSVVSFPTTGITILNPTGPSTDVVIADNGTNQTFTLQLTVDDSQLSSTQNFTINTITANKAPNVFAGAGGTITLPTNTFTFNGTVTDDGKPVGGQLTVKWSMINGPAPVTFSSLTTPVTTVTFPNIPGTYTFRLTANDGQLTSTSDTGVVVNPVNQPPQINIVSITPGEFITLPANSVTITTQVTDDGKPSGILNIAWTQLTGPAPVVFSAPNQASTQITFSAPGFYAVQIQADDTQLHTSSTFGITVQRQNQAPVVSAGPNQSIILPTNTVQLNGTVQDDGLPFGATVTIQWSEVSGPAPVTFSNPNNPAANATFSVAGTYDLRLSANDTQLTGTSDVIISVLSAPQNLPPVVSAGLNQTVTLPGPNSSAVVNLNGSVTDDGLPVGKPVTQQWSEVSGPAPMVFSNPTAPFTQATFTVAGVYRLRLTATDTQLTSSADAFITVNPPINQPPVINSFNVPSQVILPNGPSTVTFSANVTDDGLPNGTLTVQWVEVSGPLPVVFSAPNSQTTQVTFPAAGTYIFQLSAFDGQLTTIQNFGIPVRANQPPFVSVTATPQTLYLPNTTTLTANATDDGLPNGQLLYSWSQTSGPAPATLSSPNAAVTQASFTVPGTYVFEVAVSDTQLTTTADMSVVVNPSLSPLTVSLFSPVDGDSITHPVGVTGIVSNAGTWKLEYALTSGNDGDTPTFVQFATGSGPQVGASLGTGAALATFDPTVLLNGIYTIRLTATDVAGNIGTISTVVSVAKNAKVGVLTLAFNDLTVPVPGVPIQIMRMYDSRDKSQGDFGIGWNLGLRNVRVQKNRTLGKNWNEQVNLNGLGTTYCLEPNGDRTVTITFPDNRVYEFQAVSGPECQQIAPIIAPTLQFAQIPTVPGTAGATLQPADGAALFIDGSVPGPQNIVDGAAIIYNPTVFQLTTAEGFTYIIDQKLGVTSVTDPSANKVTIGPNGISSSTGLSVPFVRDAQGRITQITDLNGNVLKYTYSDNANLTGFTDGAGKTTGYGYANPGQLIGIFTPNNGDIGFSYDPHGSGRLALIEAAGTTNIASNLAANQETITDANGNPTTYTYDADGNVIQTVDALGHMSSATWDANDNELTKTDALGKTTTLTYDSANNKLTETDALGNTTKYTYNGLRQVLTITDPNGNVTSNAYDTHGNLLSSTDALGNASTYTYNAQGQPLTVKDALGNTTSFVYDGNGRMTQQTDALNNVSNFTYDANGNKLTQSVTRTKADGTKETLTTQYQYDGNNRLLKTINPDNSFTQIAYNSIGKQSDVFDALNHKTHYDYDTLGRLIQTTYADGTTESITYDGNNNRQTTTDRAGRITSYAYDAMNRLTKTTYPDNSTTQTVYDADGRAIKTIDALNNVTQKAYDDAGRYTSTTDTLGHVTSFTYDAAGNQLSMTDALNHTTQFVYDVANRRIQTVYPDKTTDSVSYDSLGRMSSKTDQAGKVTQFGYDPLGRLTSVTDALGQITKYGYDELGNRISQTDANTHTTKFVFDQLGRRTSRSLPLGMSESYGYDAVGNMTSKKDFNSHTTIYAYDTVNRLLSKTADAFFSTGSCSGGACGATQVSYTYTATGRRATMSDFTGITAYTYDQRDRLLTKANSFGRLTYTYDAAGNTLSLKSSNAGGASMTYTYDPLNRLATVQDASGTTSYSYDAVGNLGGYSYPNGVQTSYTYNTLNRLTSMQAACGPSAPSCGAPNAPVASYAYTLGAAGNRLSVTELSGRTVNYGYDDLYRLTSETVSGAASQNGTVGYQYDAVGNRLKLTSTVAAIPSGLLNYDANDRLSTDGYDANGNTINNGGIANVYDFENHMVKHDGVLIAYDGDGNRVQEAVAGVTTSYLVADQNLTGYAQVMDELQSGSVSRTYSYGFELINERQSISGAPTTSFYGFDGHGSVRFLTSSTGAITDTYDYDAFGNLISSSGATPNNYLFAGEQFDPALGIYYNRARYYDERSGRFWTLDTWEGDPQAPISLHKYLYVSSNPINRIDPSGNQTLTDFSIALGVIGTVVGLTISAGIFLYAAYNAITRLPKDAFTKPPDAKLVGFQTSRSLGDFIPKSSPFLAGLAIGLAFTAGVGGVDVLFPRSNNLAWFYAYAGVSAGFKAGAGGPLPGGFVPPIDLNPNGLDLPEFYVGAVWNVEHPEDYAGPFFCVSGQVAAARFPGVPRGPNVQVCSSTKNDGTPGAYSLVLGGSNIQSSLSASITKYYFYGETPIK